jgi:hypothetical protein
MIASAWWWIKAFVEVIAAFVVAMYPHDTSSH